MAFHTSIGPNPYAFVEGFRTARSDVREERRLKITEAIEARRVIEAERGDNLRQALSNAQSFASARGLTPGTAEYQADVSTALSQGGFGDKASEFGRLSATTGRAESAEARAARGETDRRFTFNRAADEEAAVAKALADTASIENPLDRRRAMANILAEQGFGEAANAAITDNSTAFVSLLNKQTAAQATITAASLKGSKPLTSFLRTSPQQATNPPPIDSTITGAVPTVNAQETKASVPTPQNTVPLGRQPTAPFKGVDSFVTNNPTPATRLENVLDVPALGLGPESGINFGRGL